MEYIASAIILGMAVLCQWFLAPEASSATVSDQTKANKKKQGFLLVWDLVLLVASWVVPQLPVVVRWSLWLACWVLTTLLILLLLEIPRSFERRACIVVAAVGLFVISLYPVAFREWIEERSAVTSGDLCVFRSWKGDCFTNPMPIIEIGDSGSAFVYGGLPNEVEFNKFAYNVGLTIERGPHGTEISTKIRDKFGIVIAEINKNHWTVVPTAIRDKNYTDSALEVVDARDQVVFQIRFLPDRVQIAGEWRDEFGHGLRWSKCTAPDGSANGCVTPWGNAQTEQQNAGLIEPMFQYPSKEHWGELIRDVRSSPLASRH